MKNFLINTVIFLLVLVGSLLVGWHFTQENFILWATQVPIVTEEFEINFIENEEEEIDFDWTDAVQLGVLDWLPYINYEVAPIGELIIPSINLQLPVLQGPSHVNMTLGAGTLLPGMVMGQGNFTLAAHWDPNPGVRFGGLHLVNFGDLIILRDAHYLHIYEAIIVNYVIGPYRNEIAEYVEGKVYVTLFTCTPDGEKRVMVRGELVEQISNEDVNLLADAQANADVDVDADIHSEDEPEILSTLGRLDVEMIREVIEIIEYTEVPFPVYEAALVIGGSLVLAAFVVWISNKGSKR